MKIEIGNWNWNSRMGIENENQNWNWKLKLKFRIENGNGKAICDSIRKVITCLRIKIKKPHPIKGGAGVGGGGQGGVVGLVKNRHAPHIHQSYNQNHVP